MIWNENILFLHLPKTAGMSMTALMKHYLSGRVCISEPGIAEKQEKDGVTYFPGKRHENLFDAESFFTYRNRSIFSFKKIFVVMRNPYDLEVSRYFYLRKGNEVDRGPAQEIAKTSSFSEYLEKAPFFGQNPPRLDKYFSMGGMMPDNLVVLRYENLENDIEFHLSPYFKSESYEFGHINKSNRKPVGELYNKETEEMCYRRHRWFFDKGFYSRVKF